VPIALPALLALVVVVVPPAAAAATKPASVCARFRAVPDQTPVLGDPVLTEVSGLAASRVQPPLLWVHNDSGGQPAVYAIRPDGSLAATYLIAGATNTDWEDIAVGPGPARGVSYLYVGDIGDNLSARDHLTVYRVAEPTAPFATTGTLAGPAAISLRYPTTRSTPSRCSSIPAAATSS
jgi:hypothetical protein